MKTLEIIKLLEYKREKRDFMNIDSKFIIDEHKTCKENPPKFLRNYRQNKTTMIAVIENRKYRVKSIGTYYNNYLYIEYKGKPFEIRGI